MKKKYQVAAIAMAALTAGSMAVPSVYAQTTSAVKNATQRMAGAHRGPFDQTKMLEDQASILGITIDDLKARLASGKTFKDIVTDLGLTLDQIKAKMDERRTERLAIFKTMLQKEVTDGKITQAEADQRIAHVEKGPQGGMGMGMMGRGKGMDWKNNTRFLEDQASILGITVDDLKTRLDAGKTIPDIAKDLGISDDALKIKMEAQRAKQMEEMKATIQKEVTDGKITQAQADQMLERLTNPIKHGFGRGMGPGQMGDGSRKSGMGSPKGFGGFHNRQNGLGSTSTSQQ